MDLITHGAVGLALGSLTGVPGIINNPLAIGTIIGSVIPDGDIVYQLKGDYSYLKHHRGPSHSIVMGAMVSLAVSGLLGVIFSGFSFWNIFLWTFGGYMLHIGLDIFNAYGANILWPFSHRKIESGLFIIFDPALLITAGIIFISKGEHIWRTVGSGAFFLLYLLLRWILKRRVYKCLAGYFGVEKSQEIAVMPSALRLFRWDFILYRPKDLITGRVNILRGDISIRERLKRNDSSLEKLVMETNIGKFFKDFSPHYHIDWVEDGKNHKAVITDLRYYIRGNYLHHATALFNAQLEPIYSAFRPYNKQKEIKIPV